MNTDQADLSLELITTAARGVPEREIQDQAKRAKLLLFQSWMKIFREAQLIDTIVAKYAPDPNWVWGVVDPYATPAGQPTRAGGTTATMTFSSRRERILAIASEWLREGREAIRSSDIAERLVAEGEKGETKNLLTSVGNTLSRNGWLRVGDGIYLPSTTTADTEDEPRVNEDM